MRKSVAARRSSALGGRLAAKTAVGLIRHIDGMGPHAAAGSVSV